MQYYMNDGDFVSYLKQVKGFFWKHLTLRRAINVVRIGLDYVFKRERPGSRPLIAKMEISNRCNLRCPLCLHGEDVASDAFREKRFMTLETFRQIMDEVGRDVFMAFLYHKGESFLNKELLDMCEEAKARNVATLVSSNFSLPFTDEEIERMVTSGLSYLIVSLDGVTQEVYEQYRVGGDCGLVFANVDKLVAAKKRLNSSTPVICWQYVKFDHNEHEIPRARELAPQIGVDQFVQLKDINLRTEKDYVTGVAAENLKSMGQFPFQCKWLWTVGMFLYDGELVPCCYYDWKKADMFGNINADGFGKLWNGPQYVENRRLVSRKVSPGDVPEAYCLKCPLTDRN